MEEWDDIPKYRKKKDQSSKSSKHSDHKHIYKKCLIIGSAGHPHRGKYCTICGKHAITDYLNLVPMNNSLYRMLSDEEVFDLYPDLERIPE